MKKAYRFLVVLVLIVFSFFIFKKVSLIVQVYGTEVDNPDRRACLFFSLPDDSVDCIFVGTSHVFCSYNPQQIYDETGLTSVCLATSGQSFQSSYYLLKEALRKQTPKVVIMDLSNIAVAANYDIQNFRLHFSSGISALPDYSINKVLAYNEIRNMNYGYSDKITIYDCYGILEYRADYDREKGGIHEFINLLFNPSKEYKALGYFTTEHVFPQNELISNIKSEKRIELTDTIEFRYYKQIEELLEKKGIQLVMVRSLYNRPDFDDCQLLEQFFDYLNDNQVPYIDFFKLQKEIGIDLKTDFQDSDHLNCWGSEKTTKFIGNYLKDNFSFEKCANDKKHEPWNRHDFNYRMIVHKRNQ